jgi:hypothetical protein
MNKNKYMILLMTINHKTTNMDIKDTYTSSTHYCEAYYPTLINTKSSEWKFQEKLRIAEASNFAKSPERAARGWVAIDSIKEALCNDDGAHNLSPEYVKYVTGKLAEIDEKKDNNVRRTVKDIWTWPMVGFPSWNHLVPHLGTSNDVVKKVIQIANEILASASIVAIPALVEGKIYLTLSGFRSTLWSRCREAGIDLGCVIPKLCRPLTENFETEHVTLVNSDVLAKLLSLDGSRATLMQLLDKCSKISMKFTIKSAMHTLSLDWARFGVCFVMGIDLATCPELISFMQEFNDAMGSQVKIPSPHITVAIDSRM